jgi:hypothetical protein
MAKTTFVDNVSTVLAAWLNQVFSHLHDGADADGHVAQIDSLNHIAGASGGTFDLNLAGFTAPLACACTWRKNSQGIVTLYIANFSGTSSSAYLNTDATAYAPAAICPAIGKNIKIPVMLSDSSTGKMGFATITSAGAIIWSVAVPGGAGSFISDGGNASFTSSGTKGCDDIVIQYSV